MTAVEHSGGNAAHALGQAPPPEAGAAPAEPPHVNVLDLLRSTSGDPVVIELTGADVAGVVNWSADRAPVHLGTIVTSRLTEHGDDFGAYCNNRATQERAGARRRKSTPTTAAARKRAALIDETPPGVRRYENLLQQVDTHNTAYEDEYEPGGKINHAKIGDLYDITEGLDHPAVNAVEGLLAQTRDPRIRTALIRADRLIRFMVHAAVSRETA